MIRYGGSHGGEFFGGQTHKMFGVLLQFVSGELRQKFDGRGVVEFTDGFDKFKLVHGRAPVGAGMFTSLLQRHIVAILPGR